MLDTRTEDARSFLTIASSAIEAKDPRLVFGNNSRVAALVRRMGLADRWAAAQADLTAGHRWDVLRRLVGASYVVSPERLRPDEQAMLTHLATLEAETAVAA